MMVFLGILCILQLLLTNWGLRVLLKIFRIKRVQTSGGFFIFCIPLLIFYGRNIHIVVTEKKDSDSANLKIGSIFFALNPLKIFIGKIYLEHFHLYRTHLFYLNRIPSKEKIKYLPPVGRVRIYIRRLENCSVDVEDRTVFPVYRNTIREIELKNGRMDAAVPLTVIFFSDYGRCRIGSGDIVTEMRTDLHGMLKIQGITWGELINLEGIPIYPLKTPMELTVDFHHETKVSHFRGLVGNYHSEGTEETPEVITVSGKKHTKLGFKFTVKWDEYRLPFDLGLKKIVYQIFTGTLIGNVVDSTIGFTFNLLKKLVTPSSDSQ